MFNSAKGRAEYVAGAGQVDFDFVFKIFNESDLVVYVTKSGEVADDVKDLQTLGADYTIAINGDNGGTVTFLIPNVGSEEIALVRELPVVRPIEYHQDGDLSPDTLNNDQDYQTYLIAQELEATTRAVLMPQSSHGAVSNTFPAPAEGQYILWSAKDPVTGKIRLINDTKVPQLIRDIQLSVAAVATLEHAAQQHLVSIEGEITAVRQDLAAMSGISATIGPQLTALKAMSDQAHLDVAAAVAAKDAILQEQVATAQAAVVAQQAATDVAAAKANVDAVLLAVQAIRAAVSTMRNEADVASIEAQHWAAYPHGQLVPEGNQIDDYSSRHFEIEAKSAKSYATHIEIEAGISALHTVNPEGLKFGINYWMDKLSVAHSSGAPDADKYIRLRANGTLDPTVLPHTQDKFRGIFAPAAGAEYPTSTGLLSGSFYIIEGLTAAYTMVGGDFAGSDVANRDEFFWDGVAWHLVGKPDFNASSLIPKSSIATDAQAAAGTATDLVISPATMKSASRGIMQGYLQTLMSQTGAPHKIPFADANGKLDPSYLPLGIGGTTTLPDAVMTVGDIRALDGLGVYCINEITENGKLVADTMKLFAIPNKFSQAVIIPMRDKNIFMVFGLDLVASTPVQGFCIIDESILDTVSMTDVSVQIRVNTTTDARA